MGMFSSLSSAFQAVCKSVEVVASATNEAVYGLENIAKAGKYKSEALAIECKEESYEALAKTKLTVETSKANDKLIKQLLS